MSCRGPIAICLTAALVLAGCGDKGGSDPLTTGGDASTPTSRSAQTTPTPSTGADAAPGRPAPNFGVNLGPVQFLRPHTSEQIAAATKRAGAKIIRITVPWYEAQPYPPVAGAPPTYTFTQFRAIKTAMARHGLRPLLLILGTPHWALPPPWHCPGPGNCDGPPAPAFMPALTSFAGALAKEFPDAAAIEVYNETNNAVNWGPIPVNVKTYVAALKAVHDGVRAGGSKIPVLTAGSINYPQGHQGDLDAPQWLDAVYKAGAKGNFEGIGLHPYAVTGDPGAHGSPWRTRIAAARAVAARNGDRGRPIWITESGYPTGGKPGWTVVVSEAEQSRLERCEYQLLVGSKDIKVVLHNYLYDRKVPEGASPEDHWGLYHQDGTPKPIVADMARMLSRPRQVSNCSAVR